jgi:hypothetical protein
MHVKGIPRMMLGIPFLRVLLKGFCLCVSVSLSILVARS